MPRHVSKITMKGHRKGIPNPNKGKKFPGEMYTRPEIEAMQSFCNNGVSGRRDHCLLTFLHRTGCRIQEALDTQIHDLDFDRKLIKVRGTKTANAQRVVGMHPVLEEELKKWLELRANLGLPNYGYVFVCISKWEVGNQLKAPQFRQKLNILKKKAGITKRVHCHGFRHTFASEMADEKTDLRVIQKSLGHSSLQTTSNYIDHLNPTAVIEVMTQRA